MRRWNKAAAFLLAACILLGLCACSGNAGGEKIEQPESQDTQQSEPIPETGTPVGSETSDSETLTPTLPATLENVEILSLQSQQVGLYDWEDADLLVQSEYSCVTLWHEDAEEYPELAKALEQTAAMAKRSMEDEYDNLCASTREGLTTGISDAETLVSTLDTQVRRADSVVVSLLSDSYTDYGLIEDCRRLHGTNYDARTGRALDIQEVVSVNQELAEAVTKELNSHAWAGNFDFQAAVEAYFANTPYDGISWTLDYNGVTFYFADGDLEEAGNGGRTATVTFREYPQLFEEKYMAVPDGYMVELSMDSSFFTDLDSDGDLEELNVTGVFRSDAGCYSSYGIYTDTDGYYHYEECYADGFQPYYVKTAEGNHYLYLFCEQKESAGPIPKMLLIVFDVSGGSLIRVGEMTAGPGYFPTGIYRIPTDPAQFYLDVFDTLAQDMTPCSVGSDGLPQLPEDAVPVFEAEGFIEYSCYDEMLEETTWWSYTEVDPQAGEGRMLSADEVVLVFRKDKTGSIRRNEEVCNFSWFCQEDGLACITLENGCNYYLSLYEDGIEDSGMYWMMLMLEERLVWLY